MVDPRIYRGFLVVVAFAVIVFGFSLKDQPHALGTTIASGEFVTDMHSTVTALDQQGFAARAPGSRGDAALAAYVEQQLSGEQDSGISGFSVRSDSFSAQTTAGRRTLENVIATRAGLGSGTIVVVSHRDATASPGAADLYGTAVLLNLARALSGETLSRSVMLVSTSGQIGAAGAARLAQSLAGQQVDAVIVLGDLAGATVRTPVVVPWSSTDSLAPPLLRDTLASFLSSQAGIANDSSGLAGQFARLAFPFAITEQAPFASRGIPAALVSLSGDLPISGNVRLAPGDRAANLGVAILQTVNALDHGPAVGAPSGYLTLSGKLVPTWAVQLLVLALMLPVLAATVDALARTRRRGHVLARWLAWVLVGVVPFLSGLVVLLIARVAGLLAFAPPGAVAAPAVKLTGGDLVLLLVVLAAVVASFAFLRPLCLRLLAGQLPDARRRPESPAADAAAVALSVVMCVLALVVWALNPFAALLLVPALHAWLWLAQQGARSRHWSVALLLLVAVVPAFGVLVYYAIAYQLSPPALAWSIALMPGGAMPIVMALCWTVALGCLASAIVIGLRAVRAAATAPEPVVTVRGPASYAGPGSLGGTKSALRR